MAAQATRARATSGRVVETAKEARGAERGPSMFVVLTVSTVAVAVLFAVIWFLF